MPIRIANGAGFWGDNLDAPLALARSGEVDVLTLEYLAELTLAILAHQRSKNPDAGYVGDFPTLLPKLLAEAPGMTIVTNAGGLNPRSCVAKCASGLQNSTTPLAAISGDDVLENLPAWRAEGLELAHLETGEPLPEAIASRMVSANAYLGAKAIAETLGGGASVVVTGRVADASLTVGPAANHFGWGWTDYDHLAGASVAGHLIECGAQATGGLWLRWDEVPDLAGIGYPIALVEADGSSIITKPNGSGGIVTVANVAEQLVYEIDDPSCYRTPDVDVDLAAVALRQEGLDRVRVSESCGRAPSGQLKIAAVYRDGWTASGMLAVVGQHAEKKARAAGRLVLDRVERAGFVMEDSLIECLGAGDVAPGVVKPINPPFEVVLRITVKDTRRDAVERFCRELAPLITAGPPGIAGYASGRPSPRPAFGYWPTLIAAERVPAVVEIREAHDWTRENRS